MLLFVRFRCCLQNLSRLPIWLGMWLAACSGTNGPPGFGSAGDAALGGQDSSRADSGVPNESDASVATDASDATTVPDDERCSINPFELSSDSLPGIRHMSVDASGDAFFALWNQSDGTFEDLYRASVAPGSIEFAQTKLTNDTASASNPFASAGLVAWEDDGGQRARYQIRVRLIEGSSEFDVTAVEFDARHPSIAGVEGAWVIGYSIRIGPNWMLQTRTFDGSNLGPAQDIASYELERIPRLFLGTSSTPMAAYVQNGDVFVVRLSPETAAPTSTPLVVNAESNALDEVSMAFDDQAGIVAFSAEAGGRNVMRGILLELDGTVRRAERTLSVFPVEARLPRAIAYQGGLAVAYRADNEGDEHIALDFVHGSTGEVVENYEVAAANFSNGAIGLGVASSTGDILLTWGARQSGAGSSATLLSAASLQCASTWLRCSPQSL
ncbi:MAG: hypothetical protein AAF355_03145 [Myxococcota bacterium]